MKTAGRHVAVITRFDRVGAERIPFISAATLLGLAPGGAGSYTAPADGSRHHGHDVAGDFLRACNSRDDERNQGWAV